MSKSNSKTNALIPTVVKNDKLDCEIRVVQDKQGEPWFVATDVAKTLGYRDAPSMVRNIDLGQAVIQKMDSRSKNGIRQIRSVNLIDETGLYEVIFASAKREAQEFKLWVLKEVLPSIRKHGGYIVGQSGLTDDFAALVLAEAQERAQQARDYYRMRDNGTPSHVALKGPKAIQQYNDETVERIMKQFGMSLHMARLVAEGKAIRHSLEGRRHWPILL